MNPDPKKPPIRLTPEEYHQLRLDAAERALYHCEICGQYVIFDEGTIHHKNTGGMGAYAPLNFVTDELIVEFENKVVIPTLKGLKEKGRKFNGCLYCGLIKTQVGIKVIEFNCGG